MLVLFEVELHFDKNVNETPCKTLLMTFDILFSFDLVSVKSLLIFMISSEKSSNSKFQDSFSSSNKMKMKKIEIITSSKVIPSNSLVGPSVAKEKFFKFSFLWFWFKVFAPWFLNVHICASSLSSNSFILFILNDITNKVLMLLCLWTHWTSSDISKFWPLAVMSIWHDNFQKQQIEWENYYK